MYSPMSPSFASDLVEARDSESVPPTHKHRTLILCFDGTGKIYSLIRCLKLMSYFSGDQFDDDVNFHLFPASIKLILFYSRIQILSISFLSWGRMTVQSNSFTIRCVFDTSDYTCGQHAAHLQAGIGTYTIPQVAKPMMAKVHKVLDAMIGVHLNAHVMSERDLILCGTPTETQDRWLWIPHAKLWAVILISKEWKIQHA